MILTKDKLREIGTSEGLIDILLGHWPDGIPTTSEALIRASNKGLDLCRVGGLIDWSKWPRAQGVIRDAYKLYQETLGEERAKIDAAYCRYQETHAEVMASVFASIECERVQSALVHIQSRGVLPWLSRT